MTTLKRSLYHSIYSPLRKWIALCLALLAGLSSIHATDDILLNAFNSASEVAPWGKWWGSAPQTYAWDGSLDANANPNSGTLRLSVAFNLASYGGDNQFSGLRPFPRMDGSQYTNVVMDILMDTDSPKRPWGDYGYLEIGFRHDDPEWSQNVLVGVNIPATSGWLHIVAPINPNAPKIDIINGLFLKMWSGDASWGQTGTTTFWIDNIKIIARTDITAPPPDMSIEKAKPGLKLFASAPGNENQRQSIRTTTASYSWVGATDPVTYSIGINDYPDSAHNRFQTHLFLVPGNNIPTYETTPDWNEPHCVFLQIANNADGTAYAAFRYKINQPSGNTMLFGNGTIGVVGCPQVTGTWNLTFNPSGDINLTAPNGASTNFTMPADAVSFFNGPTYAYIGVQPNSIANIGQSATISHVQITGTASAPIDDAFDSGALSASTWQVIAEDPAGVTTVAADAAFWVTWTLPDRGFALQVVDDLTPTPPLWSNLPITSLQIGDRKRVAVRQSQLPLSSTGNYFFQLKKVQ